MFMQINKAYELYRMNF